jgi:hypothetical protein
MTPIRAMTVVQADVALATIEAGVARVAATLQLLAGGIRRQDSGRQSGCPVALDENIVAILGGETEIPFPQRVVRGFVGNTQSRRLVAIGEQAKVPQMITSGTGGGHRTAVHMSTRGQACGGVGRGRGPPKGWSGAAELLVELGT